ncbi:NAD(P)H-quinone oxidoreductase [Devosia geojensis]|uniref:NAD(P)H-quinone oxidoreductase n=1 Tax=Devosia geojensis TaxID=443610 RepID=A0A0F5FD79_9HYPH|nr:NAD(P)H-quinone oxidoreductase [Devosia geojensis]KKB06806.1 NAD(P)H-quinone oxidoreductase [Devosia geojensis]
MTILQTIPERMTAISISAPGGPEVLTPVHHDVPRIGETDVLIRVAAAGVNGPDLSQRRGQYAPPPGASPLPGLEVAGEIAAVGSAVDGFAVGDEVMALTNGGGYAEYVAVPAGQVLPLPTFWSMEEAAALPECWFTVTQTLVMRAGLEPGMSVLVHGAAGGVGGAAVSIAAALGAWPIAVVSSPRKAAYARALGAAEIIDRTREDLVEHALALTGDRGVDRVVDLLGGETAAKNIAACARGGHIVQVSTLAGGTAEVPLRQMMARDLTLSASTLRPQSPATKAAIARHIHEHLFVHLENRDFPRPRLTVLPLEEAPAAHRALEASDHFGKVVLLTAWGRREEI